MNRKSIGAQIRSVFNVTDPFSKEFSEDSSDDETICNLLFLFCKIYNVFFFIKKLLF